MEAYSQPRQINRPPTTKALTVGMLRSILLNIPDSMNSRKILDSSGALVEVLTDEDWLNHEAAKDSPFVTLRIC